MVDREFAPTWPAEPAEPILGREREVRELYNLVATERRRLIALTGPPGIGKTRLALAVWAKAARDSTSFPGGAQYASVSAIQDDKLLLERLAAAVGVRTGGPRSVAERIKLATGGVPWLVILDGCDRAHGAGIAIGALLEHVPSLTVLMIKRSLGPGSPAHEYALGPLRDDAPSSEDGAHSPAMVFLRREIASAPARPNGVVLNDDQLQAILDKGGGDPIALRLWARLAMLGQADNPSIADSPVGTDETQKIAESPSAALWSAFRAVTTQLQPGLARLLQRLAVVPDGWTLADTLAILNAVGHDSDSAPAGSAAEQVTRLQSMLDELFATGLVNVGLQTNGELRYRVQRGLRDTLVAELERSGDARPLREAVLSHLVSFAKTARREYFGPRQTGWLNLVANEQDNIREALFWATAPSASSREISLGMQLVSALLATWSLQGNAEEGRGWMTQALAAVDRLSPEELGPLTDQLDRLQISYGLLSTTHGDVEVGRKTLEAFPIDRAASSQSVGSWHYIALAHIAADLGDTGAAHGYLERAQSLLAQDESSADTHAREWLWQAAWADLTLSRLLVHDGDVVHAVVPLRRAVDRTRRTGDRRALTRALVARGEVFTALDEDDRAVASYIEATATCYDLDESAILSRAMRGLVVVALKRGAPGHAALWLGSADVLRHRDGGAPTEQEHKHSRDLFAQVQAAQDPHMAELRYGQGYRAPLSVVAEVASGFIDFDDSLLAEPSQQTTGVADPALASGLTPLQRDILHRVVIGRSSRDIALNVGVRPDIVRAEIADMIKKIGVSTRLALVAEAIYRRLV